MDVQNIYYTTREAFNRQFNYRAFWSEVSQGRQIVTANAYAISREDGKQKGFQQILRDIGFTVKLKPFIQRKDGSAKGDWDVGIALDLMDLAAEVDTVVLASGDGDFDLALQRAAEKFSVNTEVYGVANLTASSLIESASLYVPIREALLMPQN